MSVAALNLIQSTDMLLSTLTANEDTFLVDEGLPAAVPRNVMLIESGILLDAAAALLLARMWANFDTQELANGGAVQGDFGNCGGDYFPHTQAHIDMSYPNKFVKATFPSDGVTLLSMNRPKVNALNDDLWFEIADSCHAASVDPNCRVVVLASSLERIYCAGLDLTENGIEHSGEDVGRTAISLKHYIKRLQDAVSAVQLCQKPVIAAVHGLALGGAIDIISAADVRYAAEGSVFSIKEVDVGLAADVGSLQRLPKTTGNASLLYELALTARNFDTKEAQTLGLVSKVVPGGRQGVLDAALETAKLIASKSPIAVIGTKHILNYSREHTVQEGLDYEAVWNMAMLQSEDLVKAMQAFATKESPTFSPFYKLAKL
ncbi:hypothetical protein OIO90_003522 [Microbotryomycetes sp. JL221]|nr:hypothetical protein OIO90_003522 [Microbotryomycetes sp. JL221]